jgi:hypothetical protein
VREPDIGSVETSRQSHIMTSYLVLYTTKWAERLQKSAAGKRSFRQFRFGLLPHEIAALNDR